MGLAFVSGGGAVAGWKWQQYQSGQRAAYFFDYLRDRRISLDARSKDGFVTVTVNGPGIAEGTSWREADDGTTVGANIIYRIQ